MKRLKILLAALLLLCGAARSQVQVVKTGSINILDQIPRAKFTTTLGVPVVVDTAHGLNGAPDSLGYIIQVRSTGDWWKRDTALSGGGHIWTRVASSSATSVNWGSVLGTLASQTDLVAALASKQATLGFTPIAPSDTAGMLSHYLLLSAAQGLFYPLSGNPGGFALASSFSNIPNLLQVINSGGFNSVSMGTYALRPAAGIAGRGYIATDTLKFYVDLGTGSWLTLLGGGGSGGSSIWGGITGTLASQTDLQNALNLKVNKSDTATMLLAYLRKQDTAAMLSVYLRASVAASTYATIASLGTAAAKNVAASGNASATQVVLGNDTRLTTTLSQVLSASADTIKVSNGAGITVPLTTTLLAGLESPADRKQLDSFHLYSDSVRIIRVAGTDSVKLCITPVSTGIEVCAFQYMDSSGIGGSAINQLNGDGSAGPGGGNQLFTLATVNSNPGTWGDATHVPQATYDSKGRVLSITNVAIAVSNTNLNNIPGVSSVQLTSSTGTPTTLAAGTEVAAGVITAAQVKRLDSSLVVSNDRTASADSLSYSVLSTGTGIADSLKLRTLRLNAVYGLHINDSSSKGQVRKDLSVDTTASAINPITQGAVARTYVPLARQITVNGVTQNLGADIAFTVGSGFTNPMDSVGEVLRGGAAGVATKVSPNTTTTLKFLSETGNGTVGAAPLWYGPTATDVAAWQTFTSENVANKSTTTTLGASNTLYPTQNAVKTYVDNSVAAFTVSASNSQNTNGGSFSAGALTLYAADGTHPGLVNTTVQIWAGQKEFTSAPQLGTLTAAGGLLFTNSVGVMQQSAALSGYVFGNGTSAPTASSTIPGTAISGNIPGNSAGVTSTLPINQGGTAATTAAGALTNLGAAPINNPSFTGNPQAPDQATGNVSNNIADTRFVSTAVGSANIVERVVNAYTINHTAANTEGTIEMNSGSSSTITLTFPSASSNTGQMFLCKNTNASAAVALANMGSGEITQLNGFGQSGDAMLVYSDGSNWRVFSTNQVGTLAANTYTPTIGGITNFASSSAAGARYIRISNQVMVSGYADVTATTGSSTMTVTVTLPFSSAITLATDVTGTVDDGGHNGNSGTINANTVSPLAAEFTITAQSTSSTRYFYNFMYTIK